MGAQVLLDPVIAYLCAFLGAVYVFGNDRDYEWIMVVAIKIRMGSIYSASSLL